jgi:hypothetical protein
MQSESSKWARETSAKAQNESVRLVIEAVVAAAPVEAR